MQFPFWGVLPPTPRPRGFPTYAELTDDVEAQRRIDRADLLRRAESTITETDRRIGPARTHSSDDCPACSFGKNDHYAPCARCGASLYATEARAAADANQHGLTLCRDEHGRPVEFSHHDGQVIGVR